MFRQIQNRHHIQEERNNNHIKKINNTISVSKIGNKFGGVLQIKVYIFNNSTHFILQVSYNDTIKDLKLKIFKQLEKDSRFKLNYKSLDGKFFFLCYKSL